MAITLGSNFSLQTALPLDDRAVVADLTARDAIDALRRFEGMVVYVESEETNFQLIGGITNSDWEEFSGGGGGVSPDGLRVVTGHGPITADDQCIIISGAATGATVVLPPNGDVEIGWTVEVKRLDADDSQVYAVEVEDTGTDTVDGATIVQLYNRYQTLKIRKIDENVWGLF